MTKTFGKLHYVKLEDLLPETSNILQEMKPYKRKRFKDGGTANGPEKLTKDYSHIKGKANKWIWPDKTITREQLEYLR